MRLSQKLDSANFPHNTIKSEQDDFFDILKQTKKPTLIYDRHGNITAACFMLLGSHFPVEMLTSDDFASINTVWFNSCADYIFPLLKLLPPTVIHISINSCGLLDFPQELMRFTKLEKLAINRTRIRSIPDWITTFDSLTQLHVSDNMLTSLPDRMQELTNLTSLDIGSNQITSLPDWIQNFTNLTSLDIWDNQFTSLPDWMQNLTNLTSLNFEFNQLTSLPDWMQNLTNLTSLDLGGNQLTSLPDWIQNLTNLTSLDIGDNQLTGLPDRMQKLTNLTSLNIGDNQLTSLPDWMQKLTNLTSLDLWGNNFTNQPDWIQKLTNLTSLSIGNGDLTSLPGWMQKLPNLTSLSLWGNNFTSLPGGMQKLTNLTSLDLWDNQLTSLPDWMQKLTNLTSLDLRSNQLTSLPDWMQKLTNLTSLDIGNNHLTSLPGWMQKLTNLTSLNIGSNQLTSLPDWMQKLTNLTSLNIGDNQLTSLPDWMQKLTNLTALNIANNQLTNLPSWIQKLTNLVLLDISYNAISTVPDCFDNLRSLLTLRMRNLRLDIIPLSVVQIKLPFVVRGYGYKSVDISDTTLSQMDISLFEQSHELILAHYKGELIQLRECKVIFLGDGEVGKSSLIDLLLQNKFDPEKKSTDGIKINDWRPDGFEGTLRIWDFGGQEIMHSMHNCFLTSGCVYVIVLNGRENTFIDRKALHWLDVVHSFAPKSPVIIAINKSDRPPYTPIPINKLKEKYPDIIYDSFETSASEELNIDRLAKSIMDCAVKTEGYNHNFNADMKKVKDGIANMEEYYIQNDEYKDMCERFGINNPETQVGLLKWFKDLGVSFYYKDKPGKEERPSMEGYTILKPDWLTNGIYRLINRAEENSGIIKHNDIFKILNSSYENDVIKDMTYSKEEAEYILFVMRIFKLSYKLDLQTEDGEFIPVKCPKDMPISAANYKKDATLHLSWESEFIPYNALYQIMVEMHGEIDLDNTWRFGSVFKATGSTATVFIEMDIKEEKIDVYVKTESKDAKEVLYRYRTHILKIIEKLGIKPDEYMHVNSKKNAEKVGKVKYATVIDRYTKKKDVYVEDLNEDFDSAELFGIYYTENEMAKAVNINIESYHNHGGSFMPDNKIEVGGNNTGHINANQGSAHATASQQVHTNEPLQRITAEQYEDLKKLLNEFTQSKDFKKLGLLNRCRLKAIVKDNSYVSGWEKFRSFISNATNLSTIAAFAATYGSSLAEWIGHVLKIAVI